jgi:uncharacterized protein YeeX (DUF496 family)
MKFYFLPYHIVKDKIQSVIENNKEDFKENYGDVEVDYNHFETLSALGMAHVAMAVKQDLVGFAGFIINHNATDNGIEAENVVFYIDKNHRGKLFKDLLDFSKKEFSKMGVNKMIATIKSDSLGRALRSNNFKKEFEIWGVDCE